MISFTRHAKKRLRQRHPKWGDRECEEFVRLAMSCGKLMPGYNGCRRYRWSRKEVVVKEINGEVIVVTVV